MALTESTHTCPECGQEWSSDESEYCPECGTHYNENPGNLENKMFKICAKMNENLFKLHENLVKRRRGGTGLDLSKLN